MITGRGRFWWEIRTAGGSGTKTHQAFRGGGQNGNHKIGLVFLEIGWKAWEKAAKSAKNRKIRIWDGDLSIAWMDPSWKVSMDAARATSFLIHDVWKISLLVEKKQQNTGFPDLPSIFIVSFRIICPSLLSPYGGLYIQLWDSPFGGC